MKAVWESLVRTFTPIAVGAVLGWFTTAGIELDGEFSAALTLLVSGALSGAYYVIVRLLETYVAPNFGWLLGLAKAPEYEKRAPTEEVPFSDIKDAVLVAHAQLDPDEQNADIQAAISRTH